MTEALHAAFSLLPRRKADMAIRRVMERARQPVNALGAFEIRWAEFDLAGCFLRGGISDISDLTTTIVTNSQSDPGISLLARRAAAEIPRAGLIEWDENHERFLWYLPFRFFNKEGVAVILLRGLLVTDNIFGEIMELFNGDANLTQAEKRALFQLVGGMELRKAATRDNVSYETKRAHTKAASEKLGCTGQKDLIRSAMGQLVHLMSIGETDISQTEPAVTFTQKYLQEDMQLVVSHHKSGAKLRYLIGGPASGRPVMMVHGMMFPIILRGIAKFLYRNHLRLYVPIRTGYLEGRPLGALYDHGDIVDQSLREISYVAEEAGLPPVPLIGNSLGGAAAVRLARKFPQQFSHLILMSPNLANPETGGERQTGAFYDGMRKLRSDSLLFKLVNLEYRKFYSDSEICKHILRTHFSRCDVDLDVLDGRYCGHAAYKMFASTYKSSIVGIAEDFRHVMLNNADVISNLEVPLSIIHGQEDPLTSFAEVKQKLRASKSGVERVVNGAGHFAAASHGNEVWRAVKEACNL